MFGAGAGRIRAGRFTAPKPDVFSNIDTANHAKYDRYGPQIAGGAVSARAADRRWRRQRPRRRRPPSTRRQELTQGGKTNVHPFFEQPEALRADADQGIVSQAWSPIGGITSYLGTGAGSTLTDPSLAAQAR
jgi:hypothetical protein